MASKAKQRKYVESTPTTDKEAHCKKGQQTMFLPTDVILKVEGESFHLNRKWLAENSPVFKTMFESEFKEKHNKVIHLHGKKFKDFETFLFSFYFPANIRPIQGKNKKNDLNLNIYSKCLINETLKLLSSLLLCRLNCSQSCRKSSILLLLEPPWCRVYDIIINHSIQF